MKAISRLSLKVILPSLLVILLAMSVIVVFIIDTYDIGYIDMSQNYINMLTESYAKQIESKMSLTLNTATTLSRAIEAMISSPDPQREEVLSLVATVLSQSDDLVGIGVGFEPNAFDGRDSEFLSQSHSDASGRFVPYTYNEGGKIDHTLLIGYDDLGPDGSWYSVPKATNKTYVTNPYWYEVGSEKYLIYTCVSPILDRNGKFIGMVGFDTKISSAYEIIENAKLFETGYLTLISPDGTIAYHPSVELMGQHINDITPPELAALVTSPHYHNELVQLNVRSLLYDEIYCFTLFSIEVGNSGWSVLTNVPLSEINSISNKSRETAIVAGIIVALVLIMLMSTILHLFVLKPTKHLKRATDQMAKGSLHIEIPKKSSDEFGLLAANLESTSKKLSAYVQNISDTLGELAKGNLTVSFDLEYIGDFIPIKEAITNITNSLHQTLTQLSNSSRQIAVTSSQVMSGAEGLSRDVMHHASASEELAITIDEVLKQFKKIATDASFANNSASTVKNEAIKSNQHMQSMVAAMDVISTSAGEIRNIIKSIEDIALQTNILALNAAVEAAHAGDSGRGFAVVAGEVRNLANKSAEAAKYTAELIDQSLLAVENGVSIARETASDLQGVTNGINEVSNKINEIATAANGQVISVDQVTIVTNKTSSIIQSYSSTAVESAAASKALADQAHLLDELVDHFKLN